MIWPVFTCRDLICRNFELIIVYHLMIDFLDLALKLSHRLRIRVFLGHVIRTPFHMRDFIRNYRGRCQINGNFEKTFC